MESGPAAAIFPESWSRRAELQGKRIEVDGDLRVRIKPVQLETAVLCDAVIATPPVAPSAGDGHCGGAADDPGVRDCPAVRSDDRAGDGQSTAKLDVHLRAGAV